MSKLHLKTGSLQFQVRPPHWNQYFHSRQRQFHASKRLILIDDLIIKLIISLLLNFLSSSCSYVYSNLENHVKNTGPCPINVYKSSYLPNVVYRVISHGFQQPDCLLKMNQEHFLVF